MNYLDRYLRGEHAQVWKELQGLGADVRQEPTYSIAREIAAETMRRVRRNCERIVSRLDSCGYTFGVYPDGSHCAVTEGPLITPSDQMRADQATLESRMGPLPVSLCGFWEAVGEVDLMG